MLRLSDGNRQKTTYMMQPPKSIAGYRLGLASGSPRRRELLAMLDIPFHIVEPLEIDENYPADLEAREVPLFLSRLKADAYRPSTTICISPPTPLSLSEVRCSVNPATKPKLSGCCAASAGAAMR